MRESPASESRHGTSWQKRHLPALDALFTPCRHAEQISRPDDMLNRWCAPTSPRWREYSGMSQIEAALERLRTTKCRFPRVPATLQQRQQTLDPRLQALEPRNRHWGILTAAQRWKQNNCMTSGLSHRKLRKARTLTTFLEIRLTVGGLVETEKGRFNTLNMTETSERLASQRPREGYAVGYAEGYRVGYAEGFAEGFRKGVRKVRKRVVRDMTAHGYSLDQIVDMTGIPADEVRSILDKIARKHRT